MRWRSLLLVHALGALLVASSSCIMLSAAVVGSLIRVVRRATGGSKAEVLLERSPERIYQAIQDIEDEARDLTIEKVNRRKTRLRITWRSATVRLHIVRWNSRLTSLHVAADHGNVRMTDEELVVRVTELVCEKLEVQCTKAPRSHRRQHKKATEAPPTAAGSPPPRGPAARTVRGRAPP